MLGPVACFTCGKRLGALWETYYSLTNKYKNKSEEETWINLSNVKQTPEGKAMDELGIDRYCCRRVMLGNVDLIEKL